MTRDDGNGPLALHSIPTLGQVKRNLAAAKGRCESGQRPYPPLLVDLEYVVMQLENALDLYAQQAEEMEALRAELGEVDEDQDGPREDR